jgi:hydrogenase-4 membrane subunit HyfE
MKGILKWPLIIAAVLIVARIVAERMGASDAVTNSISVVVLHVLIIPIYFAIRIARSDVARPYRTHLKLTTLFAILARLMVAPTYWLAYALNWTTPRFTVQGGGVVGADSMLQVILTPLVLVVVWTIASVVVGGLLGALIILVGRKLAPAG